MFVTFRQNNIGGYFIEDDNVGAYVIIEGNDLKEILDKASNIFEDYREYCTCCGERWDDDLKDENDLKTEPMIWGESVYEYMASWCRDYAIIYRIDGTKEKVN